MDARSHDERVADLQARRDKARKRAAQYDEQIKRLERKAAEEERKQRTHSLIVCGAEIAALFDKVLDQDEIYTVVNFLREQRDLGFFTLEKAEMAAKETDREEAEKRSDDFGDLFGGFFDF
jgi:hypothetical protein